MFEVHLTNTIIKSYQKVIDNYDKNFDSVTVSFIPVSSEENEEAYMNSLSIVLSEYDYKGYIAPSAQYKAVIPSIGNTSVFVADKLLMESFDFKIDYSDSFKYVPATLSDVTVLLGSAYRNLYMGQSGIDIKIEHKQGETFSQITAKIVGYFDEFQFDPISQEMTDNMIVISNIEGLVEQPITYNNTKRMYSLVFDSNSNITQAKAVLSEYGSIIDFAYNDYPHIMQETYNTGLKPLLIAFVLIICAFIIFSIMLYVLTIIDFYGQNLNEYEPNELKHVELFTIIALLCCCVVHAICSIFVIRINNFVQLLPYFLILALICCTLIYENKRIGQSYDRNK